MGLCGIYGADKSADAKQARGAENERQADAAEVSKCDRCKSITLTATAVLAALFAVFAILNGAGIVMDPTLLHSSIVAYVAGGASALLAIGIVTRNYFCSTKADKDGTTQPSSL